MPVTSLCFVAFPVFVGGMDNFGWCWECCRLVIHCVSVWSCGREVECIGGHRWCGKERLSGWSPSSMRVDSKGKKEGVGI